MQSSHVRYRVVAFAVALAAVTYLDRVCISVLAKPIMNDLNLTPKEMSWVFSAFTLAYGIFEIPTGRWADRVGSRSVLTRIVIWWSAFTMLTATAFNYVSMLVLRFMFGIGEAGAWPNAARVFSRWIPSHERGRVQGIFFAGAHLSGGLTPALVAWIASMIHWRLVFVLFSFVGAAWAFFWWRWFRDEPREHSEVSPAERDYIEKTRGVPASHGPGEFREAFQSWSLIPLCTQYFANAYGFYFFITWLWTYLADAHKLSAGALGLFAGLPLGLSVIADISGGITTDALSRRFGVRIARCSIGATAYFLAAIVMYASTQTSHAMLAATLIAVAGAFSMFTLAPSWATAIDMGGKNAAVLGATMNTAGQVGGFLSPIILTEILTRWGGPDPTKYTLEVWNMPLIVLASVYMMAAVSWLFINPPKQKAHD